MAPTRRSPHASSRSLWSRRLDRPVARPRPVRLGLETLEDRAVPAAYSIRLLSPAEGVPGNAEAIYTGGLALAAGPRAANDALIVEADTAADAARAALAGTVTVSFQGKTADYTIGPAVIGGSLGDHLPFLLGQPDATQPELWRIALEDLAAENMQPVGVDWDYDDRSWAVDVRPYQQPIDGTGTGLLGRYFAAQDLTALAGYRVDPTVAFDWGSGAPSAEVPADHFSVCWTGWVQPKYTDWYTFRFTSDDGARVWINGTLVIDNWTDHGPTTDHTVALPLVAGQLYTVRLEYYEKDGGATAQLGWASAYSQPDEIIPTSQLYPDSVAIGTDGSGSGLLGTYRAGMNPAVPPVTARVDATVGFDWGGGAPAGGVPSDGFSVVWTGQVQPRFTGNYTFYTRSDDGVRLWVDGVLLVNNWTDHGTTEDRGTAIALVAGQMYDIRMEYYENGGGAVAQLLWSSGDQVKQIVPTSQLYPDALPFTVTTLTVAPSPSIPDQQVQLTATVAAQVPEAGEPTGTVTFVANGTVVGTAAVNNGAASVMVSFATAGTYTITASYAGDPTFVGSSASVTHTVTPAPDGVPPSVATGGSCYAVAATSPNATAPQPPASSPNPVRYADGVVSFTWTDLSSDALGGPWGHSVGWTNGPGYASGVNGNGTVVPEAARLVRANGTTSLALVSDGSTAQYYDLVGGVYRGRFYDTSILTHDPATGEFVLTDSGGNRLRFHAFDAALPAAQQGALRSYTASDGTVTSVTAWTADGQPQEVQRTGMVGGVSVTESFQYTYGPSGPNAGKLASVALRRQSGGGAWQAVQSAEYAYYETGEAHGNAGDLKTATVRDASGTSLGSRYFRYYTSGEANGYAGGLKYALSPSSLARLTAELGGDVAALSDEQIAPFADHYFEYDSTHRVTREVVQGAGCSSCGGGLGAFTYAYTSSNNPAAPNSWATRTIETLPDGTTNTVYTNAYGQVLLTAVAEATGGRTWLRYYRYDASGRLVLAAEPSAVSGYDEGKADLVDVVAGNAVYLRDADGVLVVYAYGASTTATPTTAGDVQGYLKETVLRHGELGSSVPQLSQDYLARTAGGMTVYVTASETVYRNDDGTGAQTTTYGYVWRTDTVAVERVTVTLPAVTVAQNGSGIADAATVALDAFGRVSWSKDEAGYLTYTEYDSATGAVVKLIEDVDTTRTAEFANLPAGWATPQGGGLHRTSTYEVDALGRVTKTTDPAGVVSYIVYNDAAREVRVYAAWDATINRPTGPTVVSRDDWAGGYTEELTMTAAPTLDAQGRPTGQEAIAGVQTLARAYTNRGGQVTHTDEYFDLTGLSYSTATTLGVEGVNYYRTRYEYNRRGLLKRTETPTGTVTRLVYDALGRVTSTWVGLDDTPTSGSWSPTNTADTDLVQVIAYQYDGGGVGDGNLTQVTAYPGGGASNRVTQYWYDWRDRLVATKAGVEASEDATVNRPLMYTTYDNLGQVRSVEQYDGDGVTQVDANNDGVPDRPSASLLRAQTTYAYDEQGRLYRSETFSVDPATGSVSTYSLRTDVWYDPRGLVLKTSAPGGLVSKASYDGLGRVTVAFTSDGGGDAGYADADDVTGDVVLEQAEYAYDAAGNVVQVTTRRRFHDATGTGVLGTPSSGISARASYVGLYYDALGRLTASVDLGTNGGVAWTRPTEIPERSDAVLVSSQTYNAAGWLESTTDPRGVVSKTFYDALGRVTKTVENYVDGIVSDTDDKTVEYTYDGSGHLLTLTARLTGGGHQTTGYVYGVRTADGSAINSNDILAYVQHPDPVTGDPSSSEQESYTVNALGEVTTATDRNGTTHAYAFDVVGRVIADSVTTLGAGVDAAVRRIETAYNSAGQAYLFTSYDAVSGGNVVNQVQRTFNGLGQLTREYQAVAGAVDTSTTPYVGYSYSEMAGGANHSRLTAMTYPDGKVLSYDYASGLDDRISRLSSLSDASGILESYAYLGLSTVVRRAHPQPGIDLTYIKQAGEADGVAGDQYTGLDAFDRVIDQRWLNTSDGTATDRLQYGYDRGGNRLYRENLVDAAFSELYGYDALGQLTAFQRGTLNAAKDAITGTPTRTQAWDFDALGNFDGQTTDGVTETRTHDAQNEITSISGQSTPTYDANGSMTGDEQGRTLVYDAWNRLVRVTQDGTSIVVYTHDGLGRRVTEGGQILYYSAAWQVIEERESGLVVEQTVYSPVYVDALVLRDRDTDANGTLDERLWVQQDANYNVTALLDGSGVVVERYAYDPFGAVTVLTAAFAARASSAYEWVYLHQGGRYEVLTGLYHFRHREYSPTLGRWTSVDPLGFAAGDVDLYRALGNGPADHTDPFGLQRIGPSFEMDGSMLHGWKNAWGELGLTGEQWSEGMEWYRAWQKEWEQANRSEKCRGKQWYEIPNPKGADCYPPGFLKPNLRVAVVFISSRAVTFDGFAWVKLGYPTQSKYPARNYAQLERQLARLKTEVGHLDMLIISGHGPTGVFGPGNEYKPNPPNAGVRFQSASPDDPASNFDDRMPKQVASLIKELLPKDRGILVLTGCGSGNSAMGLKRISARIDRHVAGAIDTCYAAGGPVSFFEETLLGGYADGGYCNTWDK